MPFTSVIGGPQSLLGNMVPGNYVLVGAGSFGYRAHVLTSRTVRVVFDDVVDVASATDPTNYEFSSVSHVPSVTSVREYELGGVEFEITFSESMFLGGTYSLVISNVFLSDGSASVSSAAVNFVANVPDPPRAVGAFLSKRGFIDVVFDRPVGPYSPSPVISMTGGTGPATVVAWDSTIPERNVRIQIPVLIDPYYWDVAEVTGDGVYDVSGNSGAFSIHIRIPEAFPRPLDHTVLSQFRIVSASVTGTVGAFLTGKSLCNVRVYFSGPVDPVTAASPLSWSFSQDVHLDSDPVSSVAAAPATDIVTLGELCNDLKKSFERHKSVPGIHRSGDRSGPVMFPDIVEPTTMSDLPSVSALLNELVSKYVSHAVSDVIHLTSEPTCYRVYPAFGPDSLSQCIAAANALRDDFDLHLGATRSLQLSATSDAVHVPAVDVRYASYGGLDQADESAWFVDLRIESNSPSALVRVVADGVMSEDLASATSSGDSTGNVVASGPCVFGVRVVPDSSVSFRTGQQVAVRPGGTGLRITGPSGVHRDVAMRRFTSLHAVTWAITEMWAIYDHHISAITHIVPDGVNVMVPGDVPVPPLSSIISSANSLLSKFLNHRTSSYHPHDDLLPFDPSPSSDERSLSSLVELMYAAINSHVSDTSLHMSVPSHKPRLSSPLFDSVEVLTGVVLDEGSGGSVLGRYSVDVDMNFTYVNIYDTVVTSSFTASAVFPGVSNPPCVASVVPQPGLLYRGRTDSMSSDKIHVFFSKPMTQDDLSVLSVTGGTLDIVSSSWSSPTKVTSVVSGMGPVSYDLSASGLTDAAGNQVP